MIGDVLVSSIICNNLKKAYPDHQIHYMVYASTTQVLEGNPNIDKLVLFTEEYRQNKLAFFKFMISLRKENYDIIIDAYSKLESWLTVLLSNAKQKISYKKNGKTFLYTDNVKMQEKPKTNLGLAIERRLSLLDPLHLDIDIDPVPKLYVTKEETAFAKKLLKDSNIDTRKQTVMISIIGSSENKTYPLRYMSGVINFIADNSSLNILFNYIPNQITDVREIYDHCKIDTQKQIYFDVLGGNLREYIALMNECTFIIGNDGGAMNIAKALNKPSFIIFSPWIEKQMWATFEDGKTHKSVHLKDYKPELFKGKTEKELKNKSIDLYQFFKPDLIFKELKSFLDYNLFEKNEKFVLGSVYNKILKTHQNKLTALAIIYNEVNNIKSLLNNLSFADEIIVVDSFSKDGTIELVQGFKNVKLIQHKFVNFSDVRNFAIKQASNDWVLFIDADERISNDLKNEIKEKLKDPKDIKIYGFYRQFYFKDAPLRFSGYQTNKVFRLFDKNYAIYDKEKLVHETLNIDGQTKLLSHKLDHYFYQNEVAYKGKLSKYAKLRAKELYQKNLKPSLFHFYIKPAYRFFNHYIMRLGILDGENGFKISKLNAFEVQQRYVELKKLYKSG